jgi:hypothetical protein
MANNDYYSECCLCPKTSGIQWHHNLIFASNQVNEQEMILPLCAECHDKARESETKEKIDLIMYRRMTDSQFLKYDKAGYIKLRFNFLEKKYKDIPPKVILINY